MEKKDTSLKLFEDRQIRAAWDAEKEEWFFSVVDVVGALTDQPDQRGASNYWAKLKQRLKEEGADQLLTNCQQLKMKSAKDGKYYATDVADTKGILRLIQSIPSPKAEPFKMWLAQVGSERLDEMADPEIAMQRALYYYKKKGYSDKWISQRLKSIEFRKDLTDEWDRAGIQDKEYGILTNLLTRAWSGMSVSEYKQFKGIKKESLRDNMTNTELVLNMLAEVSTTEISRATNPQGLAQSKRVARQGGAIAKNARKELEERTGNSVLSQHTAADVKELDK